MSQKILQFIEIDIDYCSLTYSIAPCQASLTNSPPTGTIKCFNTLVTCQDRAHFSNAPVTLRFAVPTNYLPSNIDCIPNIKNIQFDPAVISLGQDLGQRATLTVAFDDHRHSDTGAGFDKYLADSPPSRNYNPYSQGTFWGKFRARQPFLRGRNLRWITGHLGDALSAMETRHYIIDSFSGPTNDGVFTIVAKDLLKLADGDRAMAPATSNGFLTSAITSSDTTATLSPSGIGNSEYPAAGFVAIGGSEICSFTRSGDTLTLTRAQKNTTASAHSAQDRLQVVLVYTAQSPDIIIANLLETYAGVDASFIPAADWANEIASYLNRLYTAVIAQPTAVNTLISELIEQAGLSMWWDDRNQQIGLLVLRGLVYTTYLFSEDNVIADTFEVEEQPDKRLSQVHTYFGQINSLTSLTDKANYRSVSIIVDTQAETDYGSAAIKEIFSRWIPALGRTIADRIGTILLGRFTDPPRHIKISVLRGSVPEIQLGRGYQITSTFLQDQTGAGQTVNAQVTRLNPAADVVEVEADEVIFTAPAEDLTHRNIIIDADTLNVNLRTVHDLIYPAADATTTIICTINAGVTVGSAYGAPNLAFDVGSWPAGVTIILNVLGTLEGFGGAGGAYSAPTAAIGGSALWTRVAIKLACPAGGAIWGGGGGGGGAAWGTGGGGGGAGAVPGIGGVNAGSTGTHTAGGIGGPNAGTGGGPGLTGNPGIQYVFDQVYPGWAGAGPGNSIDGVSLVTKGTWDGVTFTPGTLAGDIRGPQVN